MNKFDEIFFQNFSLENFDGDADRMEKARLLFNELMNRYEDVDIDIDMNSDIIKDINKTLIDNAIENQESGTFNFDNAEPIDLEKTIEKLGLKLKDLDIIVDSDVLTITEYWINKKGYMMQQSYELSDNVFALKSRQVKLRILDTMMNENILVFRNHFTYFNYLKEDDRKEYYNILLEDAVAVENYEEAVIFRELLKDLN